MLETEGFSKKLCIYGFEIVIQLTTTELYLDNRGMLGHRDRMDLAADQEWKENGWVYPWDNSIHHLLLM